MEYWWKFMSKKRKIEERERVLRIAYEALDECNKLHETSGRDKIPLDEVAENLAITKKEIQQSFDILVEEGVIGDDSDRDHMNYSGELLDFIYELLLELMKQKEEEEKEKDKVEEEKELTHYIE